MKRILGVTSKRRTDPLRSILDSTPPGFPVKPSAVRCSLSLSAADPPQSGRPGSSVPEPEDPPPLLHLLLLPPPPPTHTRGVPSEPKSVCPAHNHENITERTLRIYRERPAGGGDQQEEETSRGRDQQEERGDQQGERPAGGGDQQEEEETSRRRDQQGERRLAGGSLTEPRYR
ncbi:hypothetical protein NHX12_021054 [Muraenolepis orangiensis]|uniref:Uncharacterized protein n=1 Tax=Muraenolepis orangiensis TaxID=630683 RepID=A0A9Q0IV55_9TELE|nr:hypothetical protein NHX12_021054 [Muraenolepis orangiensis]